MSGPGLFSVVTMQSDAINLVSALEIAMLQVRFDSRWLRTTNSRQRDVAGIRHCPISFVCSSAYSCLFSEMAICGGSGDSFLAREPLPRGCGIEMI